MKILFSAYNFTTKIYLESVAKVYSVTVFQNSKSALEKPHGVKVIKVDHGFQCKLPFDRFLNANRVRPEYILSFKKVFPATKVDVLVAVEFYNLTFYQFLKYKRKHDVSKLHLWSETKDWPKFFFVRWIMYAFWWYFKRNLKHVEKVFVFTNEGKAFFNTYAPELEVEVFPPPIDLQLFSKDSNKEYLPSGKLRIIINARYTSRKRYEDLFMAVNILKQKGILTAVTCIGRPEEGKLLYKKKVQDMGLETVVSFVDTISSPKKLRDLYQKNDVLVLPSDREAIGMVVPEAMACGLATITSDAVGANTYVEEGKTGFIFETRNVLQLASYLEELTKSGETERMGKWAAEVVQQKYTVDVLGQRFTQALE